MPRPRARAQRSSRGRGAPRLTGAQAFRAQAAYAWSIFQWSLGNHEAGLEALEDCVRLQPAYAPGLMSLGSVEYQRRRPSRGRELFLSIIEAPDQDDLPYVIDQAGQFLINRKRYRDGLEIYSKGAARFPRAAVLHQGIGCCAGHLGLHEEAIAASRRALQLEPENQEFLNDLGWSLCQAGRLEEGLGFLGRAVAAKPDDRLAAENLRYWERRRTRGGRRPGPTSRGGGPAR